LSLGLGPARERFNATIKSSADARRYANLETLLALPERPGQPMSYDHFRLSGEPFSLTPDPAFLYLGAKHREAMAAVQYGLLNGRGFISLIGEVGTGKTTILYSVLSQLGPEVAAAYVPYSAHAFEDLLAAALKDFGERPRPGASRLELLETLQSMLVRRDAAGRRTALVIDEAQTLSDATFEELRLLSNFETYTHKLLQIVLVGQPELQERLRQQNLRQLRQRVSVRAVIQPLDAAEMRSYILHRLGQVGGDERLFEPGALRTIVRHAQGIPRRANILCHNALLFAFGRNLPAVTARVAAEAVAEMDERSAGRLGRRLRGLSGMRSWRPVLGAAAAGALVMVASGMLSGSDGANGSAVGNPLQGEGLPAVSVVAEAPEAPSMPPPDATAPVVRSADQAPEMRGAPETWVSRRMPDGSLDPNEVRTVNIGVGESVLTAARRIYGRDLREAEESALLGQIRRLNPSLRDVNVVRVGSVGRLPAAPAPSDADRQDSE
jgi:general secretion pathway protein A